MFQLAHKYAPRRLEAACTRALAFDQTGYGIVKRILQQGLDAVPSPATAAAPAGPLPKFARPWTDFFAQEA